MEASGTAWPIVALAVVCAAAGWLAAALVRERRLRRRALEDRGRLLERERESAAEVAVDAERARIARELHDIVSHSVSLMVVQAGAAREVMATMPDEAEAALRAVEGAGRGAMTELRHLLGVLAPSQNGDGTADSGVHGGLDGTADGGVDGGAALAPQPTMDRLDALIDRFAFAGLPVEVRITGEPRPLPAGIDVTAYRIVQEALTNALKHGAGEKAEVTVRYAERSLRVEVLNSGPSVLSRGPNVLNDGLYTLAGDLPTRRAPDPSGTRRAPDPSGTRRAPDPSGARRALDASGARDGTGRGLLGLRERVAVYGGDLDARRRLGGGYRVRARIPLDSP
ncbi:sensor histidine kinase [Streptomyces sp. NPDC079020]|uniref:sensor histidine kinase n=1 Tax=Streptomyces sp. NPDC079020 TaxID=3365722 RepID=UPI0037CEB315